MFDFSNYPKDSKFFDPTNKEAIGKMKDESARKIISEFFGLQSKIYSMKNIDSKESNTAKGANLATELNEFKDTLFNKEIIRHKRRRIQSKKHKIGTYEINKISSSVFDEKKDFFQMMEFIRLVIFIRTLKNRLSQIIINK